MRAQFRTPDERYILSLYEAANNAGDLETPFNRYEVGKMAHLNPKAVNAICKLLVQANFIIKSGEVDIVMTRNGEQLALRLLGE